MESQIVPSNFQNLSTYAMSLSKFFIHVTLAHADDLVTEMEVTKARLKYAMDKIRENRAHSLTGGPAFSF